MQIFSLHVLNCLDSPGEYFEINLFLELNAVLLKDNLFACLLDGSHWLNNNILRRQNYPKP